MSQSFVTLLICGAKWAAWFGLLQPRQAEVMTHVTSAVHSVCTYVPVLMHHESVCVWELGMCRMKGVVERDIQEVKAPTELSQSQSDLVITRPSTLPVKPSGGCHSVPCSFLHYLIVCREPGPAPRCLVLLAWAAGQRWHKQCLHFVLLTVERATSVNQGPVIPACCDTLALNAFAAWKIKPC